MKITFEPGDVVEIEDDFDAPYASANCKVELLSETSPGNWLVRVDVDSYHEAEKREFTINTKWFFGQFFI